MSEDDGWVYTEESVSPEAVKELMSLLALDAPEGFYLTPEEDDE